MIPSYYLSFLLNYLFLFHFFNYNSEIISEINKKNIDESNKEKVYYQILEYAENGELKDYVIDTSTRIPEKISASRLSFKV